ncbi:PRD domain-containing protein [Dickeya parazeae]|uniref:Transcriptional antiterminator, BglG n=1 Tax=Dickeya zeae (strain Ech586) TaxID=590409 RepID=D2C0F0_DICZ5|nr:PRD domain-containing protein [Dickeya parazeae]ACZ79037.1 transcriptional antiterminator, BglG [Dickeya parazeae Ech586]MBP2836504.1 PRD domain-containing protein [Dickeya parazeae]
MIVQKVLNNSLVLSSDDDNREVIVMGKGIGFNSRPGDEIAQEKIEKLFVTQSFEKRSGYIEGLSAIPDEVIEMAAMIISRANLQLSSKVREQIFFTLADHLTFAIERSRKGIVIQNRLLPEVRRFYPQQFRVASEAVAIIRQQYGIELPEEESGNIAFHLVNGQSEGDDVAQAMQSVKMLKDIFNLVQYHFKKEIDTESINYSRFMTHMQFFLQRLQEGEISTARDSFLLAQVIKEYPDAYRGALLIRDYVKVRLDITLGGNELLWLTVHLVRISGLDA